MDSMLGGARSNVVAMRYSDDLADLEYGGTDLFIEMSEGVCVWIIDPLEDIESKMTRAMEAYLGLGDAQRTYGYITDASAAVSYTHLDVYKRQACAAVGFLDDFIKFRFKRNLGLRAYQKILFQAAIALLAGFYCWHDGLTVLNIPFTRISVDIGAWMIPLAAFVFVAATNCVLSLIHISNKCLYF